MGNQKLSIIVPVYNEEKTITTILDAIAEVELIGNYTKEVICVNDCSKDRSQEIIEQYIADHPEYGIVLDRKSVV